MSMLLRGIIGEAQTLSGSVAPAFSTLPYSLMMTHPMVRGKKKNVFTLYLTKR
jgi:hypothetical protein